MSNGQPTRMTGAAIPSGSRVIAIVSKGPDPGASGAVVPVPEVLRASQGDALGKIQESGLNASVVNDYSATVPRGRVIAQTPSGGMGAPSGGDVHLIVSSGEAPTQRAEVPLPDVVGLSEADAVSALQASGFSPQVAYETNANVPAGFVIAQLPNRDSVAMLAAKKSTAWMWVVGAVVAVILAFLAFYFLLGGTAAVPDVVGLTQAEATEAIVAAGFVVGDVVPADPGDSEAGTVLEQSPAKGEQAREGTAINLVVAGEPADVAMPNVVGKSEAEATEEIEALGLTVTVTRAPSATIDKGFVASQAPQAGAKVAPGTEVGIVVSEGQTVETVNIPDVTGMTEAEAVKALADAGLEVFKAESPSDSVPAGTVIEQAPAAGASVSPGSQVAIIISTGPAANPDEVQVPDVIGLELADAQERLTEAGFQVLPVKTGTTGDLGTVVAQAPAGGAMAQRGSAVVVFHVAP